MAKQNTIRKTIHRNVERELVRDTYSERRREPDMAD